MFRMQELNDKLTELSILIDLARFRIFGGLATSIFSALILLLSGKISCKLNPMTFSSVTAVEKIKRKKQTTFEYKHICSKSE